MGCARGRHRARALQVALSAERRGDAVVGLRSVKPNHHARWWMGVAVSGEALHKAKARLEIRGARGIAGAGMWRKWVSPRVWRLVLQTVVEGMAMETAPQTGGRGTDGWQSFGTDWTGRPKKQKDPIYTTTRGKVDGSGCMHAA